MRFLPAFIFILAITPVFGLSADDAASLPDAPAAQSASAHTASAPGTPAPPGEPRAGGAAAAAVHPAIAPTKQQPKRILGFMPNYRAVSAGAIPPPPTPEEAFKLATQNSFDYSSILFVGLTSMLAEGSDAHPTLGKGVPGFWAYTWRGFLDKTDGNYMVIFVMPTIFHQDERYFTKGEGSIWKRGIYAGSRVLITPNYKGHNSFNASELLGRGVAQGISLSYYPSADRNAADLAEKYGYAIGRDALTNTFREFWPDIAVHVLHRHP